MFKNYLASFKLKKNFIHIFLTDVVAFSLIFVLFFWFSKYLQNKSTQLMQGRTAEEVQKLLVSSNPEQILPFLLEVRSFLLIALLFLIVLIAASLFIFSYSRAMIWHNLLKRKLNKHWRWNLLNISLIVPLAIFGFAYLIVKLITALFVSLIFKFIPGFSVSYPQFVQGVYSVVNNIVSFYLILLMVVLIFLIYQQFTFRYRIWDSIGESFKLLKKKLKPILKLVFLAMLTALVLTLVLLPLKKFIIHLPMVYGLVNLVIAAIYFAWLRLYVLRVVYGHQ